MGCMRALVCLILPPLAVLDRGQALDYVTALMILHAWRDRRAGAQLYGRELTPDRS